MNFYFEASKTLERLDAKQGSIQGTLSSLPDKDRKRTTALVIETLKYKSVLTDVIIASNLLKEEKKITSMNLALVLVHDLLLSKLQAGDGPVKQAILRHKTRLNAEFQKIKIKRGVKSNLELVQAADQRAAQIPRYMRVNTAVWTTAEAIEAFVAQGYTLSGPFESSQGFAVDDHIPDLLSFSPKMQFQDNPFYKNGSIIVQDKASCFPALVLSPPAHDSAVVIDATAAPGNKTSHLSALMQNKGKLFAFERDRKRFATLQVMLSKAHCKNTEPINTDFLTIEPLDPKFTGVTHILLDPSCSGSGIVNRLDYLLETEEENASSQDERLAKLAAFQLMMIKHAMKFPSVIKIVYSTCSIHATENEHVVRQALESEEAQIGRFTLASRDDVLPTWPRRGMTEELNTADALSLVRCSPGEDATNGFFVSCFVKRSADVNLGSGDSLPTHGVLDSVKRKRGEDSKEIPRKKRKHKKKQGGQ